MDLANRSSILWQLWNPAAVSSAGATAAVPSFEEILLYVEIILVLIFLPIVAGMIYLINRYMFNSRKPRGEDIYNNNHPGEKK